MSRPAVIAQKQMITFQEAQEKKLLLPLSSIAPAATLLYVSHRWVGVGQPDAQDASTQMQLRRYLEEHAGQGIHFVWLDVSCINVENKEEASYEQYVSNVVTVLMRCTHLLAVPPCRTLDPRTLVRDMTVARMAEKNAAVGEHPEYLKKVPSTLSMNLPADGGSISFVTNASGLNVPYSVAAASAAAGGASASAAGGGRGVGVSKTTGKRRVSTEAMIAQAVEQEVDAAIVERKAAHLDKWSALLISPDTAAGGEGEGIEIGGVPAEGGHASLAVAGGGGKAHKPSHATANGGHASVGAGKGGGVAAPSSSTGVGAGGGGSSSRFVSSDRKQQKRSLAGSGKKRSSLEGISDLGGVVEGGGEVVLMTKKEKRALLAEQARSDAKAAAAEVTHDLDQMPTVLKNGVLYSDPVSLLNRGWVEMEVSLALVFGVQVLVCARWGPKVTFQTVLVKSIMSDDGETEEQGPGFKGAFLHGLERIAPDVEEAKGFVEGVKKVFGGSERPPDPTVPVKVMYAPMLELCHEPQAVVTPLVRASLALHNEGALLAFLSGELSPVNMMHRLSGLALQDVKDGFSGLGPLSDEKDRVRLVRLYLVGLSYAMGVVPKGKKAVGKPKWQLVKDNAEAQRKIDSLQREVESLKDRTAPAPVPDPKSDAPPAAPSVPGCGCVVM